MDIKILEEGYSMTAISVKHSLSSLHRSLNCTDCLQIANMFANVSDYVRAYDPETG